MVFNIITYFKNLNERLETNIKVLDVTRELEQNHINIDSEVIKSIFKGYKKWEKNKRVKIHRTKRFRVIWYGFII